MSKVDFGAKPLLFPMPVLIIGTYDKDGVPNAMNAAWGMIDPKKLKPITYDPANNTYIALGEVVGKAFADGLQLK